MNPLSPEGEAMSRAKLRGYADCRLDLVVDTNGLSPALQQAINDTLLRMGMGTLVKTST